MATSASFDSDLRVSDGAPPVDPQLDTALCDVPLPVGYLRRLRQLVYHGLEAAE